MGYTTEFFGEITLVPPLNAEEQAFLEQFADTRRMQRTTGPYCVDESDDNDEQTIISYNQPPDGQPGLWCQWIPNEDGTAIVWDQNEKFYNGVEWMAYLIEHFLKPQPLAKQQDPARFHFLQGHTLNGEMEAQGEDADDRWKLIVKDNVVSTLQGHSDYR